MTGKQRESVIRAAAAASETHKEIMNSKIAAVKAFLSKEGGMIITQPNREGFIKAAVNVQEAFIKDKSQELKNLVKEIRAAAN